MRLTIRNYSKYRFQNEWQFELLTQNKFGVIYEDLNNISIFRR